MKSIKTLALATAIVATPLMLTACGGDEETNYSPSATYHDAETTLSGKIRNAVTNEVISDKSLTVKFFQGDSVRSAKLERKDGYYSISDIPTNTSFDSNFNEFRIEVKADGYIPFQGVAAFDFSATDFTDTLQDKKFFKVGNVYLYPVGYKTPDYKVTVTYNNQRIANTEVIAELTGVTPLANNQGSTINAAAEQVTRVTATTDANGVATFAGAGLVLGGAYKVSVLPTTVNGLTLYKAATALFTAGQGNLENNISLTKLTNGTAEGLYVVSATNEYGDAIPSGDGKLVITFSKEVEIVPNTLTATLANATTAVLNGTTPATATAVGNTITFAPNYATNPAANDKNLSITYAGLMVNIKGINKQVPVFGGGGLTTSSGIALTGKVQITLP